MAPQRTHYQVLGVAPDSPDREIKRAYHGLARKMHPDKGTSPEQARQMEQDFALISTAYNVLKDKDKRREYDAQLAKGGPPPAGAPPPPPAAAAAAPEGSEREAESPSRMPRRSSEAVEEARSAIAKKAYMRGMQFYNLREYPKAIEYFEAAVQNDENEGAYQARLAQSLMKARRSFTRARELAMKAIELDTYNSEYRLILGEICETAGTPSLAIQAYKDVLRWDAGNDRALRRLEALEGKSGKSFLSKLFKRFVKR